MEISLTELEQAINYWRKVAPSQGEEGTLSVQVNALAHVYALAIADHQRSVAHDWLTPQVQQFLLEWQGQRTRS